MFTRISTHYSNSINDNNDVIVAIVTNNLTKLKNLLNKNNVDNVIDNKNNYTALHYAVTLPNNDITKFILELGSNPKIKQNEGYDAYELSLRSGKKFIFQYFEQQQHVTIDKLETSNNELSLKVVNLKKNNEHLIDSIDKFNDKINKCNDKINTLRQVIEVKIKENNNLKKNLEESEKAFANLSKENINVKRNLDESEKAFANLLKKNKKV